jgi:hypothetical protein
MPGLAHKPARLPIERYNRSQASLSVCLRQRTAKALVVFGVPILQNADFARTNRHHSSHGDQVP